eukprot:148779-Rhodomonas_salina.1
MEGVRLDLLHLGYSLANVPGYPGTKEEDHGKLSIPKYSDMPRKTIIKLEVERLNDPIWYYLYYWYYVCILDKYSKLQNPKYFESMPRKTIDKLKVEIPFFLDWSWKPAFSSRHVKKVF